MRQISFDEKELALGKKYVLQGAVKSTLFSEGTYQLEVVIDGVNFWPFLQLDDQGGIVDALCTCSSKVPCVHITAAYLSLFKGDRIPLHQRFRDSFWNVICFLASKKYGYRGDTLYKEGNSKWEAHSLQGDVCVIIEALTDVGTSKVREFLEERILETEETSLKFFNLSDEELRNWKKGQPGERLSYELSFWADLAKWFFSLQEEGRQYRFEFFPENEEPSLVRCFFDDVQFSFTIEKKDFEYIIPSLRLVKSPLKVYDAEEFSVEHVSYNQKLRSFSLSFSKKDSLGLPASDQGVLLGFWLFIPGKGFFSQELDPIFQKEQIQSSDVDFFLSKYSFFLKKHLKESIHEQAVSLQYHLSFNEHKDLEIETFLFRKGDLLEPEASLFKEWAYLPKLGFFYIRSSLFSDVKRSIPFEKVSDFIETHKRWLNEIEGFQVHRVSLESNVTHRIEKDGRLVFFSEVEIADDVPILDFGGWVFILERGFFPKRQDGVMPTIWSGLSVKKSDVPLFLRRHQKELEFLSEFFSSYCPVEKVSFNVFLQEGNVHIKPVFLFHEPYEIKDVKMYLEYVYVKGEGFSKIPSFPLSLVTYLEEKVLSSKEEAVFFSHMKDLGPWISQMDPCLVQPKELGLRLSNMERLEEGKTGQWLLDLSYQTETGFVPVFDVWSGIQDGKRFLFSKAGLLDLSNARFQWLKSFSSKRWDLDNKKVRLNALEWIRLQASESIILPEGSGETQIKTREAFHSFSSFEGFLPLDASPLKSTLRAYQQTGLKWLWFLYSYGLSGLLCDEMGLGKTHQAMGLMAGAFSLKKEDFKPFLVVCPTSVIYHWEELLKRFLPDFRVHVFYGPGRRLPVDVSSYDVLLTSYGIVRAEKENLSQISFGVAVYDEIQNAKNAQSQIYRALRALNPQVSVGLTGTPIENRLMELKSLFDLVLPTYLPSDAYFKENFVIPIEKEKDVEKSKTLSKILHPFILRRKKTEVLLELPEKTEEIAYCDLSEEQKGIYQEFFTSYKEQVKKEMGEGRGSIHVFALFSKLKQVCDHPCLATGDFADFESHSSGKWDLFVELLDEARESRQKVVVFTQYLHMMDIMKLYMEKKGIGFAEIRGSTRDRRTPLKRFQEDPKCEVFIASLQAAGVGIDLTAASVVIHYDRWWNPAKENQATDRVHRMGQSRGVQVFKLVTKKTIEEKIHELILKKKGLLEEVIGFDDQELVKSLTKKEVFELFLSLEKEL